MVQTHIRNKALPGGGTDKPSRNRLVSLSQKDSQRLGKGLLILGGIIVLAGSFWIGKKIIGKAVSNKESGKGFDEGTPAAIAKKLMMGFENDGWPGTDEEKVREALIQIPSQESFEKVKRSYQKQFNKNLVNDLQDELSSSEYEEMIQIIRTKPQTDHDAKTGGGGVTNAQLEAWSVRLHEAFNYSTWGMFGGTDEDAVLAVVREVPTQRAAMQLSVAYEKKYSTNLWADMKDELSSDYINLITGMIQQKP